MTKTRLLLLCLGLIFIYVLGVIVRSNSGIRISIRNETANTLTEVRLKLENDVSQNRSYRLNDLAPGKHVRSYVRPVTAARINLEFTDSDQGRHAETIVGYAETGYSGEASAVVRPQGRVEATHKIYPAIDWWSWIGFMW